MMLFMMDCQRGEILHGNIMMLFIRDCQRGKCCKVTYDARSRGIAREGEMLQAIPREQHHMLLCNISPSGNPS